MNNNSMVSIRIPQPLVEDLKEAIKKDHFLDLSEAIRSIIRNKYLQSKNPQAYELSKLREEISENINQKNQDELLNELKKIRDSILEKKNE